MKKASCFVFLFFVNYIIFQSGKFVKSPTWSVDSFEIEHGSAHFHIEHHLNRLSHEYIQL
jgi:hypothetical protein